jgi:hypothetical protein
MEARVFEDAAAIERNFADTSDQIRGIAGEDEGILEVAEAQLDAFSGAPITGSQPLRPRREDGARATTLGSAG